MKKRFIFLFLFLIFNIDGWEFDRELNKMTNDFKKSIKKKDVYACGIGGGSLGEITKISIFLVSYKKLNLDGARLLYMECLEDLVNRLHSNKKLRPHLHTYPLTTDSLSFLLAFENRSGGIASHEYIGAVCCKKGKVFYATYDEENQKFYDEDKHVETLEEAWNIYHKHKLSAP